MTTPEKDEHSLSVEALRQASDNRKEIDRIKSNFESFYREEVKFQADMKNRMDLVSKGQDHLKERFEEGTAKTLSRLEKAFGDFRVEWGSKKKEDEVRDGKISHIQDLALRGIEEAKKEAKEAKRPWERFAHYLSMAFVVSLGFAFFLWAIKGFPLPT